MEWWQSLVLGLVEGVTEYLPVSSTGHLLLAEGALGLKSGDALEAFTICIQGGAILAVLGLYWRRIGEMLFGLLGKNPEGRRLFICLVVAFLPAAIIGVKFAKHIKHYLFIGGPWGLWPTVMAWIAGGLAIYLVCKIRRGSSHDPHAGIALSGLTWKMALIIGLFQCVSMWPGTSRSLVTIFGGLFVGLSMASCVEFSFLLGLITLSAATAKDGLDHGKEMLHLFGPVTILVGLVAAWISAVIAVKWMVAYLNRHGLQIFGHYRIALGIVVGALILYGVLPGVK